MAFLTTHTQLGSRSSPSGSGSTTPSSVAIRQAYEQWDGKGVRRHSRGARDLTARRGWCSWPPPIEVFARRHGVESARKVALAGTPAAMFDPALVDLFVRARARTCSTASTRRRPGTPSSTPSRALARRVAGAELDEVLEAMADLVDLKSPFLAGHSRGVANLAAEAAGLVGLPRRRSVRRCAGPASSTTSAGSVSPTRSGTSRARSPTSSASACACTRT